MSVAKTILEQLGGNMFCRMVGVKQLVSGERHLTIKLPANFAAKKINYVTVELNDADTYDLTFGRIWGVNIKTISKVEGIYNDMLKSTFTAETGLDCHL